MLAGKVIPVPCGVKQFLGGKGDLAKEGQLEFTVVSCSKISWGKRGELPDPVAIPTGSGVLPDVRGSRGLPCQVFSGGNRVGSGFFRLLHGRRPPVAEVFSP